MKKLIILGTSRNDGDTESLVTGLAEKSTWDLINLNDYNFSYYDYNHANRDDDFLPLMKKIIENYDVLIFATPVYWYSMSGIMKVFFDRITDLLTIEKDLGRQLRGKKMGVISSSNGGNLGEQFWIPFKESANYLGMPYIGNLHTIIDENHDLQLQSFIEQINSWG